MGFPNIQASIDEAIAMAENAVSCYYEPSMRVAALWFALMREREWYPVALGESCSRPSFSSWKELILTYNQKASNEWPTGDTVLQGS